MIRNEAIESLRQLYSDANAENKAALECLIPELAESEDEKIRKWIIEEIKATHDYDSQTSRKCVDNALAYLERKKEPLTPEEKMSHPLYLEGFDVGRQVGEVLAKPAETSNIDLDTKVDVWVGYMLNDNAQSYSTKDVRIMLDNCARFFYDYAVMCLDKPAEWSEEDEKNWQEYIRRLELEYREKPNVVLWDDINWLKTIHEKLTSLRLKPHWKPSEEQIEALKNCAYGVLQNGDGPALRELYNDLEKL